MMAQNTWLSTSLDNPTWSIMLIFSSACILELLKLNALLHDVLVLELEWRFLHHEFMNVLEIIYPQY
jgi:hypothetical protein